jgi:hypothetical protein
MKKRVEMLEVVERLPGSKYRCVCDCGTERIVSVGHFNTGTIKSCGCHKGHHGHAGNGSPSGTYTCWGNMRARCHNPKNKRFADYGAVGIVVCERWRNSFAAFLADMGEQPHGMQIDRIDNDKGYEPGNCRWVTPKQNMANRSNTAVWVVHGKEYLSSGDAAKEHHVSTSTIMAWCAGRTAEGRYYPPKPGCSVRKLTDLRAMGLMP